METAKKNSEQPKALSDELKKFSQINLQIKKCWMNQKRLFCNKKGIYNVNYNYVTSFSRTELVEFTKICKMLLKIQL